MLKTEHSSYLKEYINSEINWYPWGKEAFEKAKREKKAIFLSIGYSGSQWCEMMKSESFNQPSIIKLLNQNFINIKVDKDERTDIDKYYKNVYKLMNGQGCGSPISIFMTENREPFYTAAYIAPLPQGNVLGFEELVITVVEKYRNDKVTMVQKGKEILRYIHPNEEKIEATRLNIDILNTIKLQTLEVLDKKDGGFGQAPKFPHTSTLNLILDAYEMTKDKELLQAVLLTLKKMEVGNFHDKTDGGFYRYSNDKAWNIPRFEKTAYDNAHLSAIYLRAYQITGDNFYKITAFKTIDFMLNKMSTDRLFYANSVTKNDGFDFTDKKIITSWNAMMIDTLFKASLIDKKYYERAVHTLETLLEQRFINGQLFHTQNIKAFLEDYAYLGTALLSAYRVTEQEEYLILAETLSNRAIEQFYQYGKWKFSNHGLTLYDDMYDVLYPSAMSTMVALLHDISFLIESDYNQLVFKTLEMNSYELMRHPLSSPKMAQVLVRHLKKMI